MGKRHCRQILERREAERKILPLLENIVFCYSSMCLTAAEGSLWEKADGELMLRHSMKSANVVLCSRQKTCGSGQGREVERPDAAQVRSHRVPPPADRTGARKQKRSFLLEGARDARAGWQQLGGGTEAVFSTKTQNG